MMRGMEDEYSFPTRDKSASRSSELIENTLQLVHPYLWWEHAGEVCPRRARIKGASERTRDRAVRFGEVQTLVGPCCTWS